MMIPASVFVEVSLVLLQTASPLGLMKATLARTYGVSLILPLLKKVYTDCLAERPLIEILVKWTPYLFFDWCLALSGVYLHEIENNVSFPFRRVA